MGCVDWLRALFAARDAGRAPRWVPSLSDRPGAVPFHVAIIMDGNGRWARRRGLPVWRGSPGGHRRRVRRVIEAAADAGIGQLTLYSFSTENWSRPPEEVEGLMNLHAEMIDAEVPKLHKQRLPRGLRGPPGGV